jgi:hypothetical protein
METAKSLWQRQYEESDREDVRRNALNRLRSIQAEEHIWTLGFLVEKYAERAGKLPGSLEDLALPFAPVDPSGVPYLYDPQNGEIRLSVRSEVRRFDAPEEFRNAYRSQLEQAYAAAQQSSSAKPPIDK